LAHFIVLEEERHRVLAASLKIEIVLQQIGLLDFSGKQLWTFQESLFEKLYRSLQYNLKEENYVEYS